MKQYNLLIISDLHLSEGFDQESGKTSRLEDFLFDDALARFLRYHEEIKDQPRFGGRPWKLVINGDMLDFLQVIRLPQEGEPLQSVKGREHYKNLRSNEQNYGLGMTAKESEWKLKQIAQGHQRFFAALGWFVAHGNHIVIIKGNHDIEFHWPRVQERFITEVKRAYTRERQASGGAPPTTTETMEAHVHFHPWFYYDPGWVYIEHGGQYEAANHFRDYLNPVLPDDPEHIELPWGSLFVRYLFNNIEDVHPFADNIKPARRYLKWAFKKDPIRTIEVLVARSPIFLKAFWRVARKTVSSAFHTQREQKQSREASAVSLPPEVTEKIAGLAKQRVGDVWQSWVRAMIQGLLSLLMNSIGILLLILAGLTVISGLSGMTLVYLAAATLAYFLHRGIKRTLDPIMESDYLLCVARELDQILKHDHAVHCIVLGHNHQAMLERMGRQTWYINTGAWVPVYEKEGPIEGREKLSFARLAWGDEETPELLRWDDAAGAPARVVLWKETES